MDTTQVIDELAEKFGTTAEYLIGEMTRYYIANDLVIMLISILIAIACFIAVKVLCKKAKEDILVMLLGVGCCIALFVFFYTLIDCIGWIVSPTVRAINYIVR